MTTGAPDFGLIPSSPIQADDGLSAGIARLATISVLFGLAPDGLLDRVRMLGNTELDGLGQLSVSAAVPNAGVVSVARVVISNSTTRATAIDPTASQRIRITSVWAFSEDNTVTNIEVYFGTGADITTTAGNEIFNARLDQQIEANVHESWPDGAGPVGILSEDVSVRTSAAVTNDVVVLIVFRRES